MKQSSIEGKVIVVTGGAGAIGRVITENIVKHGGIAIAADIDLHAAQTLAADISTNETGHAYASHLDITRKSSITTLINELHTRYGRIDSVINNAYPRNKNYGRKLEDVTYEDFCENVDLHLGGYFLVSQQFSLAFKEQGWGNIVNMSSIYGTIAPRFGIYDKTPMTMPVEYAAIKAGVQQLTKYFAQYLKGTGTRVNCLSPGGILNSQPPSFLAAYNKQCASKGMLDAADIWGALLFLLSDESKYLNGQNIIIDDGFSL